MLDHSQMLKVKTFSLLRDTGITKTGWQGTPPPTIARKIINAEWDSGAIKDRLRHFTLVPYYEE